MAKVSCVSEKSEWQRSCELGAQELGAVTFLLCENWRFGAKFLVRLGASSSQKLLEKQSLVCTVGTAYLRQHILYTNVLR